MGLSLCLCLVSRVFAVVCMLENCVVEKRAVAPFVWASGVVETFDWNRRRGSRQQSWAPARTRRMTTSFGAKGSMGP